ncbi:MAG TPA: 16S rRNA (guanine(966)-N(2))-methyltransferase RsmD [Bryobacteraceae bacterium]|nr:16S rRNA (guanine(966)-N(2))-methyltransferase RsmD [Bryobacteraceae bacterium]
MRVIAGEFRSRKLISVEGDNTRPTSDRLRETLFNVLGDRVEGCVFIDAYAGTGAVGIEALSRGARQAIFIEKDRRAGEVIRGNLESLKIAGRSQVIQGSAHRYLGGIEADIVFLDPPYSNHQEYDMCLEALAAKPPALIVAQHSARLTLRETYDPLRRTRVLKQGDNALSFYAV